jgi:hypothetical protein
MFKRFLTQTAAATVTVVGLVAASLSSAQAQTKWDLPAQSTERKHSVDP